jgi:hypothetical protein
MDTLYENLIRQIAGDKRIAILRGKMHTERQFNRQVELHEEIKRLARERGV